MGNHRSTFPRKDAAVSVQVRLNEKTIHSVTEHMSTDLPAEKLGELVARAVQTAWSEGHDPVDFHLVVHFA